VAPRTQPDPLGGNGSQPASQWWNDVATQDSQNPQNPQNPQSGGQVPFGYRTTTPEAFFGQTPPPAPGGGGRGRGGSGRSGGSGGSGRSGGGSGGRRLIDYPRSGRRGVLRWLPSWKLALGTLATGLAAVLIAITVFYAMTPIPTVKPADLPQTSLVLFSDGTQIGQFKKEQRTVVKLAQIPDHVQKAVLASEDRSFYSNRGVSPRGLIRAAWNNARGGSLQGGSTITQQYVKSFFLTSDRTVQRKAREFVISLKVAQEVSKEEILQDYLNKIYFGRNAYGIQAAAQVYYGKNVGRLTVAEGAYLAAIINGPELYDPLDGAKSKAAATVRWAAVLDAMAEEGWLPGGADAAKIKSAGLPPVRKPVTRVDRSGQRGYLLDLVAAEAKAKAGLSREELETGGYLIRTTFDKKMITKGIDAIDEILGKRTDWPKGTQVGMAAVKPGDGAILSIYGGDDQASYNAATQANVQAGSTFKVFGLIAALEGNPGKEGAEPLSLRSRFSGHSPYKLKTRDPNGSNEVKNFGRGNGAQFGQIDLLTATANSVNTVYAQLNERVDPEFTMKTAIQAGLPANTMGLEPNTLNLLGSAAPHVLDMASAYSTIAAEGKRAAPYSITSITTVDKKRVIYQHGVRPEQVFDPGVMADTTHAMRQVIQRGSGSYAQNLGRPAAGKTGTSSSNKSAWFIGFTPQLATAVALFRPMEDKNGKSIEGELQGWGRYQGQEITGGSFPVRVWTTFMRQALDGVEEVPLPEPVWGGEVVNPAPKPRPTPSDQPSPSGEPTDPGASPQPSGEPSAPPTPSDGGGQPTPTDGGQPTPTTNGNGQGNGNGPVALPPVAVLPGTLLGPVR